MKDKIIEYIKYFFKGLEIDIISLDIIEENGDFYFVKLESSDSSLLIGTHGSTIESLQRILSMCINNFSEDKIKLKLEINDYCKCYEDRLFSRIDNCIISIKNNLGEYDLGDLNSYDRKRAHSYIAKRYKDVSSKSRGSGNNRRMFLFLNENKKSKKITSKLTIDINGDNI